MSFKYSKSNFSFMVQFQSRKIISVQIWNWKDRFSLILVRNTPNSGFGRIVTIQHAGELNIEYSTNQSKEVIKFFKSNNDQDKKILYEKLALHSTYFIKIELQNSHNRILSNKNTRCITTSWYQFFIYKFNINNEKNLAIFLSYYLCFYKMLWYYWEGVNFGPWYIKCADSCILNFKKS